MVKFKLLVLLNDVVTSSLEKLGNISVTKIYINIVLWFTISSFSIGARLILLFSVLVNLKDKFGNQEKKEFAKIKIIILSNLNPNDQLLSSSLFNKL